MNYISVIVPLYRGEQYISEIINMIIGNVRMLPFDTKVELIFINDYPERLIKIHNEREMPHNLEIHIFENEANLGIHAARVRGIQKARGEYVLLLDQDDKVCERYLISQMKAIGDADIIVCNGTNDYRLIYLSEETQMKVTQFNEWLNGSNRIISPGLALIKRSAIPDQWLERIMNNNGADDLLLWIFMHGTKRKFAINREVLFEYRIHSNNTSLDIESMTQSLIELSQIVGESDVLSDYNKDLFCTGIIKKCEKLAVNTQKINTLVMSKWLRCYEDGGSIEDILVSHNYLNIAIYGMGILGKNLYLSLRNSKLKIAFGIDKRAKELMYEFPILSPEDNFPATDVIIVTVPAQFKEISRYLNEKVKCPVISIQDIFSYCI